MNTTTSTTSPYQTQRMEEVEQVLNFISARRVELGHWMSVLITELGEEAFHQAIDTSEDMARINVLHEIEELIRNEPLFNK